MFKMMKGSGWFGLGFMFWSVWEVGFTIQDLGIEFRVMRRRDLQPFMITETNGS